MIKRNGGYRIDIREKMRGGDGSVKIEHFWESGSELKANTRLFARLTLEPGSSIGFHNHDEEEEVFVIVKGTCEADDNGEKIILKAGDTILTGGGAGHSIKNVGEDTLEVLAVISSYK